MSRDGNGTNYFGFPSRPASLLMAQVWFNFNQVFNGFGFIFSNPKLVQVLLLPVKPGKIKNFQKWQNINKNNKLPKGFREV